MKLLTSPGSRQTGSMTTTSTPPYGGASHMPYRTRARRTWTERSSPAFRRRIAHVGLGFGLCRRPFHLAGYLPVPPGALARVAGLWAGPEGSRKWGCGGETIGESLGLSG